MALPAPVIQAVLIYKKQLIRNTRKDCRKNKKQALVNLKEAKKQDLH